MPNSFKVEHFDILYRLRQKLFSSMYLLQKNLCQIGIMSSEISAKMTAFEFSAIQYAVFVSIYFSIFYKEAVESGTKFI